MTQNSSVVDSASFKPLCIAVDWGTTNLRAFLVDQTGYIHTQRSSDRGILTLDSIEFESVLGELFSDWLQLDIPIYMAGMVGSRGGWQEVPYRICPIQLDTLSKHLRWLKSNLPCDVAIVPGLQSIGIGGHFDVMRGEETQLLGVMDWLNEQGKIDEDVLCCLPGTHSKWVPLSQGKVTQFSTSFSGELFARLNNESSLVKGLPKNNLFNKKAFQKGLVASQAAGGILHHLFSVRSDYVCGDLPTEQVRDYLSGIIIGHDVNDMLATQPQPIKNVLIIGNEHLSERYQIALSFQRIVAQCLNASEASIRGLTRLARQ